MSEFQTVSTAAELDLLDIDDIVDGYRAGLRGASEPGSDKSRSYWHGWRNGMVDTNRMPMDAAMWALVREHIRQQRAH